MKKVVALKGGSEYPNTYKQVLAVLSKAFCEWSSRCAEATDDNLAPSSRYYAAAVKGSVGVQELD